MVMLDIGRAEKELFEDIGSHAFSEGSRMPEEPIHKDYTAGFSDFQNGTDGSSMPREFAGKLKKESRIINPYNPSDGWVRNSGSNLWTYGGGRMPPGGGNGGITGSDDPQFWGSLPGVYYQAEQKDQTKKGGEKEYYYKVGVLNLIEKLYTSAKIKLKDLVYKIITQGPILFRDGSIEWINERGKFFDYTSSAIETGLFSGCLEIATDDYKNRLDMYYEEETKTILGFRRWTDRNPEADYVQFLKKETIKMDVEPVLRAGRLIKIDDLVFDDRGRIARIREDSDVGGELIHLRDIRYDSKYFIDSHAEKLVTANLKADLTNYRENMRRSTVYYHLHEKGSAHDRPLGESPTKKTVRCLEFPHSLKQFDFGLMFYTMTEVPVIYGLKKIAKWFKQEQALADMLYPTPTLREAYGF